MRSRGRFALILGAALVGPVACGPQEPAPFVEPPAFPSIERFEISSATVLSGQQVKIRWRVRDASYVRIDPAVLAGSDRFEGEIDSPPITGPTTFTLVAASDVGETSRSLAVTLVEGEVLIEELVAAQTVIAPGESTTLSWRVRAATKISLAERGGRTLIDRADAMGQLDVTPAVNTAYVLTAEGHGGPKTREITVLVGLEPIVRTFVAEPAQITQGGSATLRWEATNATTLTIRDGRGGVVVAEAPLNGTQAVTPAQTTTYMLVASSPVGSTAAMATLTVLPPGSARILDFTVTPSSLIGSGDVMISWSTADADTVDLLANGVSARNFPRTPSGNMTMNVSATTRFELRAENEAGVTSEMRTVTVGAPDTTPPAIQHGEISDGQAEGVAVDVLATITDTENGVGTATLFYRTRGESGFQSAGLVAQGNDRYSATIPAAAARPPALEYYLLATDTAPANNQITAPAGAPALLYDFTVLSSDTAGPSITHTPVTGDRPEGSAVDISADVSDPSGVASVYLYYKRQTEGLYTRVTMTQGAGSAYSVSVPANAVLAPGLDYYLEAVDARTPANTSREPVNAPAAVHAFRVVALDLSPPAVSHTPIANGQLGGISVTVSADVSDPSGVGAVELFYKPRTSATYSSVLMTGAGTTRVAQIPGAAVMEPAVDYYLQAADLAAPPNQGRVPASAPATPYSFSVSPIDMAPPSIQHTPPLDGQPPSVARAISADVNDGSGISQVILHYRTIGAGNYSALPMAGGPTYVASIPAGGVVAPGVEYWIEATDTSPAANNAVAPAGAPATTFRFTVGVAEAEPNNGFAQATPFLGPGTSSAIALGSIASAGDRDYYIIDVPPGGTRYNLVVENTVGGPATCAGSPDGRLRLYASDGTTELLNDDDDGVSTCALIDAAVDTAARALAAGRYYLAMEEDGNNAALGAYELRGRLSAVACGNSILETAAGEQCEDGNTSGGDGCSATCMIEPEGMVGSGGGVLTGAINPAGDTDLFAVSVTQGQFLTAAITDGAAGCPGDTVLELYGSDGITLLGSDDEDGIGSCSEIHPIRDSFARNLTAGSYFLRVRAYYASDTISAYTLTVSLATNICGNATVETGEQCDDGDTTSNDGCSATCQWETQAVISGTGGAYNGAITPVGNIDWYQLTVPQGYAVRAETFSPTDGVCTTSDTVIRLWQANRSTEIVDDDDGGLDRCSLLDPAGEPLVRNLAAGTYFLSVEDYGGDSTIAAYVLNVSLEAPRCGDAYLTGAETCDDGNTVAGDGCSATCVYEGVAETEPNNATTTATVLLAAGQTSGTILGTLGGGTDADVYSVVVPAGAHLFAEVVGTNGGCPTDSDLALLNSSGSTRVSDTSDGPDSCGRISPGADSSARALPAGTYYLRVSGTQSPATYALVVRLFTPGCGDLYLEGSEACDDGNTTSGDGCSATCTVELNETEPNDTFGTATPIGAAIRMVRGAITAGESDWYAVVVGAGGALGAFTHRGAPDQCDATLESVVEIYRPDGTTVVASDTQDGQGYCSALYASEASGLVAGTYYVRVRGFAANDAFAYSLSLDLR